MKPQDLLSMLLHRPGALCRALVDPLLPDGDGLELTGGYNGLSRPVGGGNELINPQGGFDVRSTSGGEYTQRLLTPGKIPVLVVSLLRTRKGGPEKGPRRRAAKALKSPTELLPKTRAYRPSSS
jgi:hypothetical protein